MGKKVESKFQCTGCKHMMPVIFKKPSGGAVAVVKFQCPECDSHIECHVLNDKDKAGSVKVSSKMTKPGARFLTSLKANLEKQRREAEEEAAKIQYLPTEHGYEALVAHDTESNQYLASTRELPDVTVQADTIEQAITDLNEALRLYTESATAEGLPMPAILASVKVAVEEVPSPDRVLTLGDRLDMGEQAREYEALSVAEHEQESEQPVSEMSGVSAVVDDLFPRPGYAHGTEVSIQNQ